MSEDTCDRTYPLDYQTADDLCDQCGRELRHHDVTPPLAPVVPTAPVQECASCRSRHTHAERFELSAHAPGCRQPEIRMRSAEARILELINAMNTQTELLEGAHACVLKLTEAAEHLNERLKKIEALKEPHGKPTDDTEPPSTQRSPEGILSPGDGLSARSIASLWHGPQCSCEACHPRDAHPDSRAAESPGEAPAGSDPAPGRSERS